LQQLYKECKALFPNLTAADFALRTGKKPENAWNLQVRYSKKKLEFDCKYMVANLPPERVQISNAGMKGLEEMRAGTWVHPKDRKEVKQ
jgi:hypothetical protein